MSNSPQNPYSSERIAKGLKHFVMGKALTSVSGIGTLLLVIRGLPIEEFAAYSILFGLVDVLLVATAVGTSQVLTRFIPEVFSLHYSYALRRLLTLTLGLRFSLLVLCLGVLLLLSAPFAAKIGLDHWQTALELYLLVVLFRTGNNTLYQVLEAMLHQGRGQGAFAAVTFGRFIGVAGLYFTGHLDLINVIVVEIITDAVGLLLMSLGVYQVSRVPPGTDANRANRAAELQWLLMSRRRMLSFGLKGYLQVLVIMPFSGVVNRLVIGSQLPTAQVALFGFGQSIFDQMQRFLPAQLLAGTIRPVMAARFSSGGSFAEASVISNAILKINLLLIGMVVVGLVAGGDEMLLQVTRGKYGGQALTLLLVMCLLITLESWRHVLDQLAHTVERYGFLVFTNALLGASLMLGLALIPRLGVLALPLANCVGLVIANQLVSWWLGRTGFPYKPDVNGIFRIVLATGCGVGAGIVLQAIVGNWVLRALIAVAAYAGCIFAVLSARSEERLLFGTFLAKRRSA